MNNVLMYHSIGGFSNEIGGERYIVPKRRFKLQMEYIAGLGNENAGMVHSSKFIVRSLEETKNFEHETEHPEAEAFRNELRFTTSDPRPLVKTLRPSDTTITFDDGLEDNFIDAYPVLKELGLKAYFFVMPSKIGEKGYMNWTQIKEMLTAGMVIGSHGMTHRILVCLNDRDLNFEIADSKAVLEDKLGIPIQYFSVPRGFYNRKVINLAREAGYQAAYTSNPFDNDDFAIGRVAVRSEWGIEKFMRIVNRGIPFGDKCNFFIRDMIKRILGVSAYESIRNSLLKQ